MSVNKEYYSETEIFIAKTLEQEFPVSEYDKDKIRKDVGKWKAAELKILCKEVGLEYDNKQLALHDLLVIIDALWGRGIAEQEPIEFVSLSDDLSLSEIKAIFFDANAIENPPQKLYRLDSGRGRYYYSLQASGEPLFYQSVTTMISRSLPTPPQLIDWMVSLGKEGSKIYTKERAEYGTFLHMQIASFLLNKKYNLNEMGQILKVYLKSIGRSSDYLGIWIEDLKKDLLSFVKFAQDVNFEPIGIEITLADAELGIAGTIDLVGMMDVVEKGYYGEVYKTGAKKGQPKETSKTFRKRCIGDIKSGRKGFYESHEIQLNAYKNLWETNFPEKPIDLVFNWSPKEWRTVPSYNFKDQTDSKQVDKLKHLIGIAKVVDENRDKERELIVMGGEVTMQSNLADIVKVHTMANVALQIVEKRTHENK